jgi:hypothetical protein
MPEYHTLKEFLPDYSKNQEDRGSVSFQDAFGILMAAAIVGDFRANSDCIDVMDIIYSH